MHFRRERVRIETERHIIEGTLQLPNEGYRSRMTDFLPITDAELSWVEGDRAAERHAYLALSVRHIVLVVELEFLGTFDESGGPPREPLAAVSTPPPAG